VREGVDASVARSVVHMGVRSTWGWITLPRPTAFLLEVIAEYGELHTNLCGNLRLLKGKRMIYPVLIHVKNDIPL
jgi:hypothetical protein